MKTSLLRLSLVFLFIFSLASCNQSSNLESSETIDKLKNELALAKKELKDLKEKTPLNTDKIALNKNDDPCEDTGTGAGTTNEPTDEDLLIKYDCSKSDKFQHMHIDLENQFGILSKMTFGKVKNQPKELNFRLKEVGTCKRFDLKTVKYTGTKTVKGRIVHNFKVSIDDYSGNGKPNREVSLTSTDLNYDNNQLKINAKDLFDIHIESTTINPKTDDSPQELNVNIMTKYRNQICLTEASGI